MPSTRTAYHVGRVCTTPRRGVRPHRSADGCPTVTGAGTMSGMPALATRYLRPITIALIALAAIAIALVAAALANPWRLTALYPLAGAGGAIVVLTLAGALIATAGVLRLADSGRSAVIGLLVALVAVPALCVGLPAVLFDSSFRDRTVVATRVLATSADGEYSVVAVVTATDGGRLTRLHVRSRHWLLSREATTPVAECPDDPFAGGLPPEAVRFTGATTVAVPIDGQSTVTVWFDPRSLEPERTVAMCPPTP